MQPAPQPPPAPSGAPQQLSPDGKYRWNGTAWVPNRKVFLGDYANQSIVSALIGILCGPFFLYGLYAGYKAYQEVLHKRTMAIVGIVLNAIGAVLWVLGVAYRISNA